MHFRITANRKTSLFSRLSTSMSDRRAHYLHYFNLKSFTLLVLVGASLWILVASIFGNIATTITEVLEPLPRYLVLSVTVVYLLGGMIKGLSGIGMGLICVPVVSLLYNPGLAVLLVSIPLIVTNFHQGIVSGDVRKTLNNHSLLAIVMVTVMVATVYVSANIEPSIVSKAVGLSAIGFVLLNLGLKTPTVSDKHDRIAQIVTGCTAGLVGGLTGLVVIPLVIYMMLRKINKKEFVSCSGFLLFLSGGALLLGSNLNESLNVEIAILSALAALPALLGTLIGERLRSWISEKTFRKIVLCLVFIIGITAVVP